MNGVKCSHCAAPLEPNAEKCGYCGVATPLAHERARQVVVHEQAKAYAAGAYDVSTAANRARTAMWTSVISLITCCGPAGIVGAIMGLTAIRLAEKHQARPPSQAKIAIGVGALSTVTCIAAMIAFALSARETNRRIDEVASRLRDRRGAAVLDQRLACDLVEERMLRKGYLDAGNLNFVQIACLGPFEATSTTASLRGVHADFGSKKFDTGACFARGSRWFVLHVGDKECVEVPIAGGTAKLADHEIEAQESLAQREFEKRTNTAAPDAASSARAPTRTKRKP